MKAKKILLFIIIILLLIVGVIAVIYFKTDIFKSNAQKFWKYANQNMDVIELFNNQDMQDIRNKRSNNPYEIKSELNIRQGENSYMAAIKSSAQDSNNIVTDVDIKRNNTDIINFVLAKKSNLVAFMSKELANGFIAVKNNDIQELAKEAGIEDNSNIPDTINWFSVLDVLYIQESDQKYFVETYSKIIEECTSKDNYSEENTAIVIDDVEHKVTKYDVTLTEKQTKEIAKKILTHMKDEDARAINFIASRLKLLNFPKKYTENDSITGEIGKIIEQIDAIEATDDIFIEATVYVENKQTIQTNIKIKNGDIIKIIFKKDDNKLYIIQDQKNEYLANLENPVANYIGNIKEITLSNSIGDDKNSSTIEFNAKFFNELEIEYNTKITIGNAGEASLEFEKTPRIVLNELENDKLKSTYNMIVYGLGKIYENKKALLDSSSTNNDTVDSNTTTDNTTTEDN